MSNIAQCLTKFADKLILPSIRGVNTDDLKMAVFSRIDFPRIMRIANEKGLDLRTRRAWQVLAVEVGAVEG